MVTKKRKIRAMLEDENDKQGKMICGLFCSMPFMDNVSRRLQEKHGSGERNVTGQGRIRKTLIFSPE